MTHRPSSVEDLGDLLFYRERTRRSNRERALLRIDRVGMASGRDRAFYSGKHKAHGLNVQVIGDPVGRLVWISPPLPGARHDMGAAREHLFLSWKVPCPPANSATIPFRDFCA